MFPAGLWESLCSQHAAGKGSSYILVFGWQSSFSQCLTTFSASAGDWGSYTVHHQSKHYAWWTKPEISVPSVISFRSLSVFTMTIFVAVSLGIWVHGPRGCKRQNHPHRNSPGLFQRKLPSVPRWFIIIQHVNEILYLFNSFFSSAIRNVIGSFTRSVMKSKIKELTAISQDWLLTGDCKFELWFLLWIHPFDLILCMKCS